MIVGKIEKKKPQEKEQNEPVTVKKKEKSSTLSHFLNKMNKIKSKSIKKFDKKNQKKEKADGSSSGSESVETSSKPESVMDLPQELLDMIISYWDANDFGTIADFAESEGSVKIANWARGWLTTQ